MTEILDGSLFGDDQPCFGCARGHAHGLRLEFERDGDGVLTRYTPRADQQGPPMIMHGGLVMTLADEIGAWAIIAAMGKLAFTASMECKFRAPVRVGVELIGRGKIIKPGRRVLETKVTLSQGDRLCTEALLVFAVLDRGGAEQLLGAKLPEAWARFMR